MNTNNISSGTIFKTLRNIDGKDYVEFSEVLDLFRNLANMPNFFTGILHTLQRVESSLGKADKAL